jgi:hypothetical protein
MHNLDLIQQCARILPQLVVKINCEILTWTSRLKRSGNQEKLYPFDLPEFTLTLHKYLVQKCFARSISGHQEAIAHFQDLTVCLIRFRP